MLPFRSVPSIPEFQIQDPRQEQLRGRRFGCQVNANSKITFCALRIKVMKFFRASRAVILRI